MTYEEAIKEIQRWLDGCPFENTKEAFNLAIQVLKTGEIYITGEDYNLYMEGYKAGKRDFEPKKGEWIKKQVTPASCTYVCSECGIEEVILGNFCCWCGAKMQKGGVEGDTE